MFVGRSIGRTSWINCLVNARPLPELAPVIAAVGIVVSITRRPCGFSCLGLVRFASVHFRCITAMAEYRKLDFGVLFSCILLRRSDSSCRSWP